MTSSESRESQKEPCAERLQAAVAHAQAFLETQSAAADARFSREIVELLARCGTASAADAEASGGGVARAETGASARARPAEMFGSAAARKVLSARVAALCAAQESAAPRALAKAGQAAPAHEWLAALALADALGVLRAPELARLVAVLAKTQRTDGAWADAQGEASLFLTGMFGGYLARSFQARPSVLAKAGQYLASQWSPVRVSGDINLCWEALVAFAYFYAVTGDELGDEILQRCGREFERGYRKQVLQPLDLAYLLLLCDAEAFPAVSVTSREIVEALLAAQREDGSWPGACCTRGDVATATFLAVAVLRRLTR